MISIPCEKHRTLPGVESVEQRLVWAATQRVEDCDDCKILLGGPRIEGLGEKTT